MIKFKAISKPLSRKEISLCFELAEQEGIYFTFPTIKFLSPLSF